MNAEGQVFCRLKEIDLSLQKEGVRAEIDILFSRHQTFNDFIDLGMDEGFTTRNRDHRSTALIRSGPALLRGQTFI